MLKVALAQPALVLRDSNAVQAHVAELGPQIHRRLVLPVNLRREGRDDGLRPVCDGLAQLGLVGRQAGERG
jgi:hypothetical protein